MPSVYSSAAGKYITPINEWHYLDDQASKDNTIAYLTTKAGMSSKQAQKAYESLYKNASGSRDKSLFTNTNKDVNYIDPLFAQGFWERGAQSSSISSSQWKNYNIAAMATQLGANFQVGATTAYQPMTQSQLMDDVSKQLAQITGQFQSLGGLEPIINAQGRDQNMLDEQRQLRIRGVMNSLSGQAIGPVQPITNLNNQLTGM